MSAAWPVSDVSASRLVPIWRSHCSRSLPRMEVSTVRATCETAAVSRVRPLSRTPNGRRPATSETLRLILQGRRGARGGGTRGPLGRWSSRWRGRDPGGCHRAGAGRGAGGYWGVRVGGSRRGRGCRVPRPRWARRRGEAGTPPASGAGSARRRSRSRKWTNWSRWIQAISSWPIPCSNTLLRSTSPASMRGPGWLCRVDAARPCGCRPTAPLRFQDSW